MNSLKKLEYKDCKEKVEDSTCSICLVDYGEG